MIEPLPNFYRILGVGRNASPIAIRAAYLDLCKITHPDKGGDVAKFKEVTQAYKTLSVTRDRNAYNIKLYEFLPKCAPCSGTGTIRKQRGYSVAHSTCLNCAGTGSEM